MHARFDFQKNLVIVERPSVRSYAVALADQRGHQ